MTQSEKPESTVKSLRTELHRVTEELDALNEQLDVQAGITALLRADRDALRAALGSGEQPTAKKPRPGYNGTLKTRPNSLADCWQVLWFLWPNEPIVCQEYETEAEAKAFIRGMEFNTP